MRWPARRLAALGGVLAGAALTTGAACGYTYQGPVLPRTAVFEEWERAFHRHVRARWYYRVNGGEHPEPGVPFSLHDKQALAREACYTTFTTDQEYRGRGGFIHGVIGGGAPAMKATADVPEVCWLDPGIHAVFEDRGAAFAGPGEAAGRGW